MFQDRFAELVRDGRKRQTIRKTARCEPGDVLSLRRWTGKSYRSKQEELMEFHPCCTQVREIVLDRDEFDSIEICGKLLSREESEAFARADGFQDFKEMMAWFAETHGLPFLGFVITW